MTIGAWTWLVAAGLVEIAWSQSIKPTQGFTRPVPTVVCVMLGATSVYLLTRAMADLPVGTAYAVFTGIGAIGAIILGVLWSGDPVTPTRALGLAMLVAGLVVVRLGEA